MGKDYERTIVETNIKRKPIFMGTMAIAPQYLLRGADAVYAALAWQLGTPLGTWDKELLERAAAVVPTFTPAD